MNMTNRNPSTILSKLIRNIKYHLIPNSNKFRVCDVQYVGSTCTPFRNRFNHYKACGRKFCGGSSGVPQAEFFRHFTGGAHEGFLKDVSVLNIDRLNGNGRQRESFWQYKLENFAPQGLNIKQVEE